MDSLTKKENNQQTFFFSFEKKITTAKKNGNHCSYINNVIEECASFLVFSCVFVFFLCEIKKKERKISTSNQARLPAEFKHINKRRKRN